MHTNFNFFLPISVTKSVSSDAPWVFEGIASTADIDLFGDVVYPDSFTSSIDFFKTNGKIYFDHEYAKKNANDWLEKFGFSKDEILSLKTPIGKPTEAKLTPEGLYIKGVLNKSHPMAHKMWNEFLNNDDEQFRGQIGLSIGAKYLGSPRREYDIRKGKYITYLPELLLYEVSMTPEPVNPYTWASVIKSMTAEKGAQQYHTITPDSVLYDPKNDRLIIKSLVDGENGVVHVFESYIDMKEGVKSAMNDKENVLLKALFDEEESEQAPASDEGKAAEAPAAEGDALEADALATEAPAEDPLAGGGDDLLGGDDAGLEGGLGEDPLAGGGGDEVGGDLLDSLMVDEGGDAAQGLQGDEDASFQMALDKLDTILDLLTQLVGESAPGTMEETLPAESQVTSQPPGLSQEVLKSTVTEAISEASVSLSSESAEGFGNALKSVLDGLEDKIAAKIVERLTKDTTILKSVDVSSSQKSDRIIKPGVKLSGDDTSDDSAENEVMKSVTNIPGLNKEIDTTVLKSLTSSYRSLMGYTSDVVQRRAKIVTEAAEQLGISSNQFNHYVKLDEKGRL